MGPALLEQEHGGEVFVGGLELFRHREAFFREGEAIVVPYGAEELTDAVRAILGNGELRRSLSAGGVAAARRMSWEHVTDLQEEIYREVAASRTASTKRSTPGP